MKKFTQKQSVATKLAAVFAMSIIIAGCNTIQGAGEDIESVGDAAEDAVD